MFLIYGCRSQMEQISQYKEQNNMLDKKQSISARKLPITSHSTGKNGRKLQLIKKQSISPAKLTERAGTGFKKLNLLQNDSTPNMTLSKRSQSNAVLNQSIPRNKSVQMNAIKGQSNRLLSAQIKNEGPVSLSLNVKHRPTKAIDESNRDPTGNARDSYSYLKEMIPDPSKQDKQALEQAAKRAVMMNRSRSGNNPWSGLSINSKSDVGGSMHLLQRLQSAATIGDINQHIFQTSANRNALLFSSSKLPKKVLYKTPSIPNFHDSKLQVPQVPLSLGQKMKSVATRSTANLLGHRRKKAIDAIESGIKVITRIRPLVQNETHQEMVVKSDVKSNQVTLENGSLYMIVAKYDHVLDHTSTQADVFQYLRGYAQSFLCGNNCTILAYGAAGSGKTHTMFGSIIFEKINQETPQSDQLYQRSESPQKTTNDQLLREFNELKISELQNDRQVLQPESNLPCNDLYLRTEEEQQQILRDVPSLSIEQYRVLKDIQESQHRGLVPRLFFDIFRMIRDNDLQPTVLCSYIQIYNEKMYDLFEDPSDTVPLILLEDKFGKIQVSGLSQYTVKHEWDCLNLLIRGEKNRLQKQQMMNQRQSRQHSIFQIILKSSKPDQYGRFKQTKFNLCDLAASDKEEAESTDVKKIDKSLNTLSQVIQALSKDVNASQLYPRFRESKLTRFLQDSLTIGSKTALIAHISPSKQTMDETIQTMKFANKSNNERQLIQYNDNPSQFPNITSNSATLDQGKELEEQTGKRLENQKLTKKERHRNDVSIGSDSDDETEAIIEGQTFTHKSKNKLGDFAQESARPKTQENRRNGARTDRQQKLTPLNKVLKRDESNKDVVLQAERTPTRKRPDTARSHKETFTFNQIKKPGLQGTGVKQEESKQRAESNEEPRDVVALELGELSKIVSINPSLENSQAVIETLRQVEEQQAVKDEHEPGKAEKKKEPVFTIVRWTPKPDPESVNLRPDTPTRKVVARKSVYFPIHLKSDSRVSKSSKSSSFDASVEQIKAALAVYMKNEDKPDIKGSFNFDEEYLKQFASRNNSFEFLKGEDIEKILSGAHSLNSSFDRGSRGASYDQKHRYGQFIIEKPKDTRTEMGKIRWLGLSMNESNHQDFSVIAQGAPGQQSQCFEPLNEFLKKNKLKKPYVPGDSKSPVLKMPKTSVGDGKYRGNSLGDGRVMRVKQPPPPAPKKKVKLVEKAILHTVREGTDASTHSTLASELSRSRLQVKKKHPNVSTTYPKYVYYDKGLPNVTAALYSEQSFDSNLPQTRRMGKSKKKQKTVTYALPQSKSAVNLRRELQ